MVLRTRIDSISTSPVLSGPSRLILGLEARATLRACAIETCTAVPIWWRLAVSQLLHMPVAQVTLIFDAKKRSSQGEGGITIRVTYPDTECNIAICAPTPPCTPVQLEEGGQHALLQRNVYLPGRLFWGSGGGGRGGGV